MYLRQLLLIAMLLVTPTSFASRDAALPVGKILFTTADAYIENKTRKPLVRKTILVQGDTIVTGEKGRVQILMADGTKIALHPNSALRIEAFEFKDLQAKQPAAVAAAKASNRSIYRLLKGGFRTLTGRIGKINPKGYEVKTPVATIGVRGTNYSAMLCNSDCGDSIDGLYVGVSDGRIVLRNNKQAVELVDGDFGYAASTNALFEKLDSVPSILMKMGGDGAAQNSKKSKAKKSGDDDGASKPQVAFDHHGRPVDLSSGEIKYQEHRHGIAASGAGINTGRNYENTEARHHINTNGELVEFYADNYNWRSGTVKHLETGHSEHLNLRWGRWSEGTAQRENITGNTESVDLSDRSLHWVASDMPNETVLPSTGVAHYSLHSATSPTDTTGNIGELGSATLNADFNAQTVSTEVELTINNQQWNAAGSGTMGNENGYGFGGDFNTVTSIPIDESGSSSRVEPIEGSGEFAGVFGTPDSEGQPLGAAMTYEIENDSDTRIINGAVIFQVSNDVTPEE